MEDLPGNKRGTRDLVYDLFEVYEDLRLKLNMYDLCDLIFNLWSRLEKHPLAQLPLETLFVDETQDFTQARPSPSPDSAEGSIARRRDPTPDSSEKFLVSNRPAIVGAPARDFWRAGETPLCDSCAGRMMRNHPGIVDALTRSFLF